MFGAMLFESLLVINDGLLAKQGDVSKKIKG